MNNNNNKINEDSKILGFRLNIRYVSVCWKFLVLLPVDFFSNKTFHIRMCLVCVCVLKFFFHNIRKNIIIQRNGWWWWSEGWSVVRSFMWWCQHPVDLKNYNNRIYGYCPNLAHGYCTIAGNDIDSIITRS